MHKLTERVELEELKKMGLLQGEVDQMMEVRVCVCVHLLIVDRAVYVRMVSWLQLALYSLVYVCACMHACGHI